MAACEHSHPQVEAVLQQADALMEAHPDSAFSLLDSLHYRQPMSRQETARYALLLAKATDKTYQSLIPCDSLLNFALKYYEKPTADRAAALLYKGCLEDEVNHDEEAITHLQEARLILQNYPEEVGTRRITLGLLGDLYYQHKHYEDCLPVYQETLGLCETDRDKSYTYSDIASYYTMTELQDSALYYHRIDKSYALKTNDSTLIANSFYSLALAFNVFNEKDSLLYYLKVASEYAPIGKLKSQILYTYGKHIYEKDTEYALSYINQALNYSPSSYSVQKYDEISTLEKDRGNIDAAYDYLQKYVSWLKSLYAKERSVDVQQLIYDYDTKLQLQAEQSKAKQKQIYTITIGSIIGLLLIITSLYFYYQKRHQQLVSQNQIDVLKFDLISLQKSLTSGQNAIDKLKRELANKKEENQRQKLLINQSEQYLNEMQADARRQQGNFRSTIDAMKKDLQTRDQEIVRLRTEISQKTIDVERIWKESSKLFEDNHANMKLLTQELEHSKEENKGLLDMIVQVRQYAKKMQNQGLHICALAFLETPIYKYALTKGENIRASDDLPIFNLKERKALNSQIQQIYTDYIQEMQTQFPKLKEEELIYLCLESAKAEPKIIAICLGYPRINAIYKLKSRIYLKIGEEK
ncbi:MAG: hypothetical protein Q4D30_09570 [Bacteroidales bacterium]|nr:hypothetical protein [Bacteroidales bacterium]